MNSRRDFLRKLGLGFGLFAISPQLLKALDRSEGLDSTLKVDKNTTIESIRNSLDGLDPEDKELTERFFEYLKNNNVGFKWERVYSPVFEAKWNGQYKPLQVVMRK